MMYIVMFRAPLAQQEVTFTHIPAADAKEAEHKAREMLAAPAAWYCTGTDTALENTGEPVS
jgi:hypothetical protein